MTITTDNETDWDALESIIETWLLEYPTRPDAEFSPAGSLPSDHVLAAKWIQESETQGVSIGEIADIICEIKWGWTHHKIYD